MKTEILGSQRNIDRTLNESSYNKTACFTDNRPLHKLQHTTIKSISQATSVQGDFAYNKFNIPNSLAISRKAYADTSNPSKKTKQIENHPIKYWHSPGKVAGFLRDEKVAEIVDQLKKEMLTYIAYKVNPRKQFGPHISVVIKNKTLYLCVNSDITLDQSLTTNGEQVLVTIKTFRPKMEEKMDQEEILDMATSEDEKEMFEALYITFRWVEGINNIKVIPNQWSGKGVLHAELCLINALNNEPSTGGHVTTGLEKLSSDTNYTRALRIGGTKIPCYTCAVAMGVTSIKNVLKTSGFAKERVVTTMSDEYGKSYPNVSRGLSKQESSLQSPQQEAPKDSDQEYELLLDLASEFDIDIN